MKGYHSKYRRAEIKSIAKILIAQALALVAYVPISAASTETVLYSFCSQKGCADGANPNAGTVDINGTLYGTTGNGGSDNQCALGCGTVFSFNLKTGAEKVLHSFRSNNNTDGINPAAGLINVKGTLYGTTMFGGAYDGGTVFSIDSKTGAETVLYSFQQNGADGNWPLGNLIYVSGLLYGTTYQGGNEDSGTIYSLNPQTGSEAVLYSFQSDGSDGYYPQGGLTAHNGTFYGTTNFGGSTDSGTVFSVDPNTGSESVLYSFDGTNGLDPQSALTNIKGVLYSSTRWGGRKLLLQWLWNDIFIRSRQRC